jgi:hypothetical protein
MRRMPAFKEPTRAQMVCLHSLNRYWPYANIEIKKPGSPENRAKSREERQVEHRDL